ncbi:class II fructose-bisphosphate aldolase [Microbacterium sp. NPDC016588]|jgi:fructose-bisphosphate aldolase class II|uniref:class II fructose-bisphosphate aldolase n=1 Tax=Microbacterium TaxID=33882 RepID=UPI00097C33BE|nr:MULTISPECIES: class II fructose-bisphosphate aldolase [Microbacterium]MBQ9917589.1 class II fructose-bisphosphate aldolase [Microbacterium sp.]MCT2084507.1 class II fructose-bisphosphate aldolase [Microbacterium enclense]MXS75180.1 class II fructose-bisphosphate aldolase [Microbacterium sp. TL13]ONI66456.1 fructose-bisphosphate aldolase [Microbacterium sp. CSI-V]
MLIDTARLVPTERGASLPAIAAFNVITLEFAEGIVLGAERVGLPVLLSVSHNAVRFHGALGPIAAGCRAVAERAGVPVGLHLDHCEDPELVAVAADHGFGSAMFDASLLDYEENVRATAAVVAAGHDLGLWIEAELGEIGGKDGAHAPGVRTDPTEAAAFVAATGVDALAVAVGTSHAMTTRNAHPDTSLIGRLADALPVPLVLHGSSGVDDDGLRAAVDAGIRKVNVGTALAAAYSAAIANAGRGSADPRPALTMARESVADVVAHLLPVISAVAPTVR